MYSVLVASKSFGFGQQREILDTMFAGRGLQPTYLSLADAFDQLQYFQGLIVGTDKIDQAVLERMRALQVIVKYGVGTDNIDKAAAAQRNIEVRNLPGINCDAVAEMALSLMLALGRKIVLADRHFRQGQWKPVLGSAIVGTTLGIVGTGSIGTALAKFVQGLNMRVLGHDMVKNSEFLELGGQYVDFGTILKESDYISLHLPLTESTYHFIGADELDQMKPTACLINTSRGPLIDEAALYTALQQRKLQGAALDVFESEPAADSKLMAVENSICTPHIAAYVRETLRQMDAAVIDILQETLN